MDLAETVAEKEVVENSIRALEILLGRSLRDGTPPHIPQYLLRRLAKLGRGDARRGLRLLAEEMQGDDTDIPFVQAILGVRHGKVLDRWKAFSGGSDTDDTQRRPK